MGTGPAFGMVKDVFFCALRDSAALLNLCQGPLLWAGNGAQSQTADFLWQKSDPAGWGCFGATTFKTKLPLREA